MQLFSDAEIYAVKAQDLYKREMLVNKLLS
jgi:hypothetical protein